MASPPAVLCHGCSVVSLTNPSRSPGQSLSKEQALLRLLEGHWRFLNNERSARSTTEDERERLAEGQYPFAAILGCADSRVSPELIFDQGHGDLFVVRVAGNIVGTGTLASIEYAIEYLGVRLVVVLGHAKCGAVSAAIETSEGHGAFGFLVREIAPAVEEARLLPGALLENAVAVNVRRSVELLVSRSDSVARRIESGAVRIVGAVYSLATGDVSILHTVG